MTSHDHYALIMVDVQYDFLPGGALPVPDGNEIIRPLAMYAPMADITVASRDWHPADHFSFSDNPKYEDGSWPPHCIQGTRGAKIQTSIRRYANFVISKATSKTPPDAYSVFAGRTLRPVATLEEILHRAPITTVVVGGLAFEYCVAHTAFDAAALKYRTIIPMNATRAIDPAVIPSMTERLERAGVEVVDRLPL